MAHHVGELEIDELDPVRLDAFQDLLLARTLTEDAFVQRGTTDWLSGRHDHGTDLPSHQNDRSRGPGTQGISELPPIQSSLGTPGRGVIVQAERLSRLASCELHKYCRRRRRVPAAADDRIGRNPRAPLFVIRMSVPERRGGAVEYQYHRRCAGERPAAEETTMTAMRLWLFLASAGLALWLCCAPVPVAAQTESATAEDGAPATEEPATEEPTVTTTVPPVQLGANLTPPLGVLPPPVAPGLNAGQSGDATVSTAAGTVSEGIAREGERAVRAPEAAPEAEAAVTCGDFPTWYDAQMMLESAVDPVVLASLDPDGDAIACEELMYP
jgi:hypothetical protein